eukprot:CAMPEP_0172688984 /NCGR_PEP_ID=MMETSP1074-20121228/22820_1 /TAXON_ID=2916 /ORGANISM="Ceratium fusus, Strain PA161109" /LENGTH=186 /DNA_ID=CAMNT_0013508717 /DNA_START=86 /DNA_END=642 /DNA_ORIENTATION=-
MVFVANVTVDDGKAWGVCVITSMCQTVLAVPLAMTAFMFIGTLVSRPFARIRQEVSLFCLCDSDDVTVDGDRGLGPQIKKRSSFHRGPSSRWNSRDMKRFQRRQSRLVPIPSIRFSAMELVDGFVDPTDDVAVEGPSQCCSSSMMPSLIEFCGVTNTCCAGSVSSRKPERDPRGYDGVDDVPGLIG